MTDSHRFLQQTYLQDSVDCGRKLTTLTTMAHHNVELSTNTDPLQTLVYPRYFDLFTFCRKEVSGGLIFVFLKDRCQYLFVPVLTNLKLPKMYIWINRRK
ncbi:hypothetical protein AMECASPLE_036401 [Ameca splendens]|uniref:Uncharacterized protein n=1 Tax=Ameca splendens TaxID=208324 RepID=A0ABV0XKN7_9TELE